MIVDPDVQKAIDNNMSAKKVQKLAITKLEAENEAYKNDQQVYIVMCFVFMKVSQHPVNILCPFTFFLKF